VTVTLSILDLEALTPSYAGMGSNDSNSCGYSDT